MKTRELALVLLAAGQATCAPAEPFRDSHVLVDNSGSVDTDVFQRVHAQVETRLADWVDIAPSSATFTLWWLSAGPYPAEHHTFRMPELSVPAHIHRREVSAELREELDRVFRDIPKSETTPLLEATYFIGVTRDKPWNLEVFSDARQDSAAWSAFRHVTDHEELVQAMLSICEVVNVPPNEITLSTWPGVDNGRSDIKAYEQTRQVFVNFLERWAPEATIRSASIR